MLRKHPRPPRRTRCHGSPRRGGGTGAFPGRRGNSPHLRPPSACRKLSSGALGKARGRARRTGAHPPRCQLPAAPRAEGRGAGSRSAPVNPRPPSLPARLWPLTCRLPSGRQATDALPRANGRGAPGPQPFPAPAAASGAAGVPSAPVWEGNGHHVTFSPANAYRRVQTRPERRRWRRRRRPGQGNGCCGQGAPEGGGGGVSAGARSAQLGRASARGAGAGGRGTRGSCAGLWGLSGLPSLSWRGCVSRPGLLCGAGWCQSSVGHFSCLPRQEYFLHKWCFLPKYLCEGGRCGAVLFQRGISEGAGNSCSRVFLKP